MPVYAQRRLDIARDRPQLRLDVNLGVRRNPRIRRRVGVGDQPGVTRELD
jgi:hypothetical protein